MLPSKKVRARYRGPDGKQRGSTFGTRTEARRWLAAMQTDMDRRRWKNPDDDAITLRDYAADYRLERRDLKDNTREDYGDVLDRHILPRLGDIALGKITRPSSPSGMPTCGRGRGSRCARTPTGCCGPSSAPQ